MPGRVVLVTAHRRESWGAGLSGDRRGGRGPGRAAPRCPRRLPDASQPGRAAVRPAVARGSRPRAAHRPARLRRTSSGSSTAPTWSSPTAAGSRRRPARWAPRPWSPATPPSDPEGAEAGGLLLVGTDPTTIRAAASRLLTDPAAYEALVCTSLPFGDGHAADRVVDALARLHPSGRTRTPGSRTHRHMRHRLRSVIPTALLALVLGAAGVLSGCSSDPETPDADASTAADPTPTAPETTEASVGPGHRPRLAVRGGGQRRRDAERRPGHPAARDGRGHDGTVGRLPHRADPDARQGDHRLARRADPDGDPDDAAEGQRGGRPGDHAGVLPHAVARAPQLGSRRGPAARRPGSTRSARPTTSGPHRSRPSASSPAPTSSPTCRRC